MAVEYTIAAIGLLLGRKCYSLRKNGMNYFWRFMVVLNLFLLVNIPIRMFELQIHIFNSTLIYWLYSASVVLMTFTMYYWFLFMLKLLDSKIVNSNRKLHVTFIPALLTIPLCIINRWTGWLFYIENGTYYRGSVFVLQGLIAYIYLLLNLIWVIYCLFNKKSRTIAKLGLYAMLPALVSIVMQILYGGSFLLAGVVIGAAIMCIDICLDKQKSAEMKEMKEMFVQTAETLASAIDAKDEYTHGHSMRVAQYSRKIAELSGFPEDECERVYFSGLLHDVGKIGIPDWIINKQDSLTGEDVALIRQHPVKGREILAHIRKLPYLTMGAKYHHERYDGLGYPEGLKATDIPFYARIIAVADSYDAMTSNRSYRKPLPQEVVRQEILNGSGRQFDPAFANIMVELIDEDKNYKMKQNENSNELYCLDYRKNFYQGIDITSYKLKLHLHSDKLDGKSDSIPTFVLFDAVDSRVHIEEQEKVFYKYSEYCDIRVDGKYVSYDARKIEVSATELKSRNNNKDQFLDIEISAVKVKDHVILNINDGFTEVNATIVLSDNSRSSYIGITGKQCFITDISFEESDECTQESEIHRIIDEINYFTKPDGDIPNIKVDSWRTSSTVGIPVNDELKLSFYAKSLPFARLIWHCPFIVLFDSENGMIGGNNYRELAFIRYDGESWQLDLDSKNALTLNRTDEFVDWNNWKSGNKEGRKIDLTIKREGNQIITKTASGGLELDNITTVSNGFNNLYVALTGDQVTIESITIQK